MGGDTREEQAAAAGGEGPGADVDALARAGGLLQIGQVADRVELSLKTVRHYEAVGLVPVARRSPGGFRLYDEEAVARLLVIKQMKPLDFTLEQMRELLEATAELTAGPSSPERRAELVQVLTGYQELTAERTRKLRERLRGAKALQDSLDELLL